MTLSSPAAVQNSVFSLSPPPLTDTFGGHPEDWMLAAHEETNREVGRASGILPSLGYNPVANSSSQYTRKESFYSESSLETGNRSFYKRLQLV